MRELVVRRNESISRLAWCIKVPPLGPVVAVVGPWVEIGDGFIVEGVWNGHFTEGRFDESYSFMGSGVMVRGADVIVVAPCNTTDVVYSLSEAGTHFFSNSLPLLLQAGGAALDPNYLDYEADCLSLTQGMRAFRRSVPLADGRSFRVHAYSNVVVGVEGVVREDEKSQCRPFATFVDYRSFLTQELAAVIANANAEARQQRYDPIVFCSAGYDSPMCAVLGQEVGCNEAVAFESKKSWRSDSGKPIVDALGYPVVHSKEELEYREHDAGHLFLGTGELGTSIFFAAARAELTGKLLLSGVHGDAMWDRNWRPSNPCLRRATMYPDTARKEFRLATGYLDVQPAFFAVARHEDVHRISNSEEMRPWQLDNEYDRPIPRRILEEAGVPRKLFGQHKRGGSGTSLRFGTRATLRRTMPPSSFDRFQYFLRSRRLRRQLSVRFIARALIYVVYLAVTFSRIHGFGLPSKLTGVSRWPTKYTCSVFAPSFLFLWGVDELQQREYGASNARQHLGIDDTA